MRKSRDRDKNVAIACGLAVIALAGLIVLSWDRLRDWYVGYRFIWLPEGVETMQYGRTINASGEVAVRLSEPQGAWAGRWSLATRDVLPLDVRLGDGERSTAIAINDAGDMVGAITRDARGAGNQPLRPFLWTKNAGLRDLATLEGKRTVMTDINERGQVVGWSASPPNDVSRAFLWSTESGIAELGSLVPEKESEASAINEAGWVVGTATAPDGSRHPFLWKPETGMQDLGLPSGFDSGYAGKINDRGEVLVSFHTKFTIHSQLDTFLHMTFVWREKDGLVKLPGPPGFDIMMGKAINNRGTVLLDACSPAQWPKSIAYLIVDGVLKKLPSAPGAKSTWYYGLNDRGWLVGAAEMKGGNSRRGFVALPIR